MISLHNSPAKTAVIIRNGNLKFCIWPVINTVTGCPIKALEDSPFYFRPASIGKQGVFGISHQYPAGNRKGAAVPHNHMPFIAESSL